MALLSQFHSTAEGTSGMGQRLRVVTPAMKEQLDEVLGSTHDTSVIVPLRMVRMIADEQPYYKYNQIWSKHLENVSFCFVLRHYIEHERLLTYEEVAQSMGGRYLTPVSAFSLLFLSTRGHLFCLPVTGSGRR